MARRDDQVTQPLRRSHSTTTGNPRLCHPCKGTPDRSKDAAGNKHPRSKSVTKDHKNDNNNDNDNKSSIPAINSRAGPRPRATNSIQPYRSAWALSPGRLPAPEQMKEKKKGMVMGFLNNISSKRRAKTEEPAGRDDAAHRLRIMSCRLLQWRFVNARGARAVRRLRSTAERKLFFALLRIHELRNVVAAKRIQIQRRKQKLKLARILNPQLQLLSHWDPLSQRHLESVTGLSAVLESVCTPVPLVDGADADLPSLHGHLCMSMEILSEIEDVVRTFNSKAEELNTILSQLVEIVGLEMEGLEELMKASTGHTTLEMHEISLRASLIQTAKKEVEPFHPLPTLRIRY